MDVPLVTVVTPVWNAAATLAEAVASVGAQTLPDWELILVDDASTDGSREIARGLAAEEPRIRLIERATNGGAAAARNDAIRAARGRLIAFLDADDRWHPEKLARQAAFMAAGGHALVFSAYRRIAADGRPLGVVRPPLRVSRAELLKGNVIGCLTAVYDTAVFGRVEMPPLRRRQDYGLWLGLLRQVRLRPRPARGARRLPGAAGLALGRQARRGAGDLDALPRGRGARPAARRLLPRPQPRPRGWPSGRGRAASAAQEGPEVGEAARSGGGSSARRRARTGGAARPKTRAKTRARARAWAAPSQTKPELSCGCTLTGSGSCTPASPAARQSARKTYSSPRLAAVPAPTPKPSSKRRPAARTGARRSAISWLEARAAFSRVSRRRRGRGRLRGRPSGSSERPTKRSSPGFSAKKRRMPA